MGITPPGFIGFQLLTFPSMCVFPTENFTKYYNSRASKTELHMIGISGCRKGEGCHPPGHPQSLLTWSLTTSYSLNWRGMENRKATELRKKIKKNQFQRNSDLRNSTEIHSVFNHKNNEVGSMKLYSFLVYLKVQKLRHFSANGEKVITPYCLWFSLVLSLLGEKIFYPDYSQGLLNCSLNILLRASTITLLIM